MFLTDPGRHTGQAPRTQRLLTQGSLTPSPAAGSVILSADPKIAFSKGSQSSKALACSILCHCMVLHLHFTLSGHRKRQSGRFSSHSGRLGLRCPTPSRLDQLSNTPEQSGSSLTGHLRGEHLTAVLSGSQLLNGQKEKSRKYSCEASTDHL